MIKLNINAKIREFDYRMRATPVKIDWEDAFWHKIRYTLIRDVILSSGAQRILDVGCGKGIIEYLLPENISCLGCDIVEEAIESARLLNQRKKNRQFLVCDIEKTSPACGKFDIIVISEVLEHLANDEKMLEKARSLLKDEGILIITVPNSKRLVNRLEGLFGPSRFQDESHVREYTLHEIEALLNRCRFETQNAMGIYLQFPKENHLPKKLWLILSFFVDTAAKKLPFLANSILLVAKKC